MINIDINPIAFLNVRWYGIMIALGVLVLILWMLWQIKKGGNKISPDTVITAAIIGIPSGIIVSRLFHVIDLWDYYSKNPGQIIGGSGLTIYGAIIGATLGVWIYCKVSKAPFGLLTDLAAPGLILAQAIGRVGCAVNGCCYGSATSLPWGIIYTHPNSYAPLGIEVQPTQVYEIIFLLLVFGLVLFLKQKMKQDGSIFLIYLGLYSLWRFGIDFIRDGTPFLFGLHEAQVIAIIVLAVVVVSLILKTRQPKVEAKTENKEA